MKQPLSLFKRTALTIAVGLLIFQLITGSALFIHLVFPLAQRSADDMADLLLLSAQVWTELPQQRRPAFELELQQKYAITLRQSKLLTPKETKFYPYIRFLGRSLEARLGSKQTLRLKESEHENFQVQFVLNGQPFTFEFAKTRITPRPSIALAWIIAAGVFATLVLTWFLARRVSAPIARLANAAKQIGGGGQPAQLPETGDVEFAELARVFNETSRQLQARRENQTTLLAGVSHDLRSPLARMKMALGMLVEHSPSPLLDRVERDIEEMNDLIEAQLMYARAQEHEKIERINLDQLLSELSANFEAQAACRLKQRMTTPVSIIEIAPIALRRCLNNLLHNALRYAGEKDIQIVKRCLHNTLYIGIRDRGPGIPAHLVEAVFRPYYRLESSRNRTTGGSGLGLAITKQIAETHHWKIVLKSRHHGGACFWLQIPLFHNTH